MRNMGKSFFGKKKHIGFRLKVGGLFFSRGTAQNFKGDSFIWVLETIILFVQMKSGCLNALKEPDSKLITVDHP